MYWVIRRRDISGRGSSDLEFRIDTGLTTSILTMPTARETQAEINKVVGLSYDVFVSSALLQQGDSSRFSNARPGQRKELLAQMLNLGELATIEKAGRKHHSIRVVEHQTTITLRQDCLNELENLEGIGQRLTSAMADARTSEDEIKVWDAGTKSLEKALLEAKLLHSNYDSASERLQDLRDTLEAINKEQRVLHERSKTLDVMISHKEDIEADKVRHEELEDVLAELEKQRDAHLSAVQLRAKIDAEAAQFNLAGMVDEHEDALARFVADKLAAITRQADNRLRLELLEIDLDSVRSDLEERAALLYSASRLEQASISRGNHLADSLQEMIDTDECPLCKSEVDVIGTTIVEEIRGRIDVHMDHRDEASQAIKDIDETISELKARVERLEDEEFELKQESLRLENVIEIADTNIDGRTRALGAAKEHARILEEEDFAHDSRQDLEAISEAAEAFSDALYQKARGELEDLKGVETRYANVLSAEERYEEVEDAWQKKRTEAEAKIDEIVKQEKITADYEKAVETARDPRELRDTIEEREYRAKEKRFKLDDITKEIGEAEANIKRRTSLREKEKELQSKVGLLNEKIATAQLLVKAASKTGAQALLIESVLPALERDANEYLTTMSPGTQVALESQRITQKGSASETLDIRVYHSGKDAPIESLSGGERFRADLALRLAIGRMLSRRSGTQVRSLFIDEGFGTQDADGQEAVVSAITSIADMFDLVLLITHIPQVSETLEQRIVVTKSGGSSVAEIVNV
jgi:exonuclease SbcC